MNSPLLCGAGYKRCGLGRGRTSAERASSLPPPTLNKMARINGSEVKCTTMNIQLATILEIMKMKKEANGYLHEIEEFSKCEDNEAFIESVKNYNRKYGIKKFPSEPKSEPKDFADGLREFIQSKAGRPISELYDKNVGDEDVDAKQLFEEIEAERDKILEEELKNPEYWEKAKQEAVEIYSQIPMYDFGLGQMSNE